MNRVKRLVSELLRFTLRWALFAGLVHCLDVVYDSFRYLRFANSPYRPTRDRQKLESLIFLHYHKIEKTLAMPDVPRLFGLGYVGKLLSLMETWVRATGETDAVVFRGACAALLRYRRQVGESLTRKQPVLITRIDKVLYDYANAAQSAVLGGTIAVASEQLRPTDRGIDFDSLVSHRHSVRNFADRHVPDSVIVRAVELAQRSPSGCNRQGWRVHVYPRFRATERQHAWGAGERNDSRHVTPERFVFVSQLQGGISVLRARSDGCGSADSCHQRGGRRGND